MPFLKSFQISLFLLYPICLLVYTTVLLWMLFSPLTFLSRASLKEESQRRNVIVGFVFSSHQVTDNPFALLAACVLTQHPSSSVLLCFVLISWLSVLPWSSISFSISPSSLQEEKKNLACFPHLPSWTLGKKINLIFLQYLPLLSLNYPCHLLKVLHWPLVPPVLEKHRNLFLQSSFCLPHTSFSFPYSPLTLFFHLAAAIFALHILSDTFHYMEMISKGLFYSSWVSPARDRKSLVLS